MEKIQADFAVRQFIDFIGACLGSDSVPLETKRQLRNITNDLLDHQRESHALTPGFHWQAPSPLESDAPSPLESDAPSCSTDFNSKARKNPESPVNAGPRWPSSFEIQPPLSPSDDIAKGMKEDSSDGPDSLASPVSNNCEDSDFWAASSSMVRRRNIEDVDRVDGSLMGPSLKLVGGPRATLIDDTSGCDSISEHLSDKLNGCNPNTRPGDASEEQLSDCAGLPSDPGIHVPSMPPEAGGQYSAPSIIATGLPVQYFPSISTTASPALHPYPWPIQDSSSQGYLGLPVFHQPSTPKPFVGSSGNFAHGYEQSPLGMPNIAALPNAPGRAPLGNSLRINVGIGEGSRPSETGPKRTSHKRRQGVSTTATSHKTKPSLRCNLPGCPNPDREFYSSRELKRHQSSTKAHSEIRIPCPICLKSLSRDDALQRHLAKVHNQ